MGRIFNVGAHEKAVRYYRLYVREANHSSERARHLIAQCVRAVAQQIGLEPGRKVDGARYLGLAVELRRIAEAVAAELHGSEPAPFPLDGDTRRLRKEVVWVLQHPRAGWYPELWWDLHPELPHRRVFNRYRRQP